MIRFPTSIAGLLLQAQLVAEQQQHDQLEVPPGYAQLQTADSEKDPGSSTAED